MSIQRIRPEDVEKFSLETNTKRTYHSSSVNGVQGKLYVFPRRSHSEKEVYPLSLYSGSFEDTDINQLLRVASQQASSSNANTGELRSYFDACTKQGASLRKQQQVEILRFTPGVSLDSDMMRKGVVVNNLMSYYKTVYPNSQFNYSNYRCLNFFTGSSVPSQTALLYPNVVTESLVDTSITGPYLPDGAFTFDFWIKPMAAPKAGTIMHLSSCYAVSVVTGSSRDGNNNADAFRVLLQVGSGSEIAPSQVNLSSLPTLVFLSDDNTLQQNNWHHVSIKWGTNNYNNGSGSFVIDTVPKGDFVIPSSSIKPSKFTPSKNNPDVLIVGNYFQGTNVGSGSMAYFFTSETSQREGLETLIVDSGFAPLSHQMTHPLHAEIHDLKLFGKQLTSTEIASIETDGVKLGSIADQDLLFYLPPFFTSESPTRTFLNGTGGVMQTMFYTRDGTTTTPFNTDLAFHVGGHLMNLENHTREFVNGSYPRLWNLSGSVIDTTLSQPISANNLLYATGSVVKAALTVLPCDNGRFSPNFKSFLEPLDASLFKNDLGNTEYGSITLRHVISTSSLSPGLRAEGTGSLAGKLTGPDPSELATLDVPPGIAPTILQRTRDDSSNQVVFFDISNLYYGNRIKPGTIVLTDSALLGSYGITLKDDGQGNLYRANAAGDNHATWSSVGNVFYSEGIILIKDPSLYFFGNQSYDLEFQGERNIHVLKFSVAANSYQQISSSNPSYLPISASDLANDSDKRFTYISNINLHDDNLNVISKTVIAQPVVCRSADKITFAITMDF